MFDRYEAGEQAVLVHIYFSQEKDSEDLSEFESLVSSAGVQALRVITGVLAPLSPDRDCILS